MGRPVNTNIKHIVLEDYEHNIIDVTQHIKANSIVILDNIICKSYFSVFDNLYIDETKYTPLVISKSWAAGGGGVGPEIIQSTIDFFSNPSSPYYLPTIVINGLVIPLVSTGALHVLKQVYVRLKKAGKKYRVKVIYYGKNNIAHYFEFPSNTSSRAYERALKKIPSAIRGLKTECHFILDQKSNKWISEGN